MSKDAEDKALARRLDALVPGWRGRLRIALKDEATFSSWSEVSGTVVEACAELQPCDDGRHKAPWIVMRTAENPRMTIALADVLEILPD